MIHFFIYLFICVDICRYMYIQTHFDLDSCHHVTKFLHHWCGVPSLKPALSREYTTVFRELFMAGKIQVSLVCFTLILSPGPIAEWRSNWCLNNFFLPQLLSLAFTYQFQTDDDNKDNFLEIRREIPGLTGPPIASSKKMREWLYLPARLQTVCSSWLCAPYSHQSVRKLWESRMSRLGSQKYQKIWDRETTVYDHQLWGTSQSISLIVLCNRNY